MKANGQIDDLRTQPFYRGQIGAIRQLAASSPETIPLDVLAKQIGRDGSAHFSAFMSLLGFDPAPSLMAGCLRQAFSGDRRLADLVLLSPRNPTRLAAWKLIALLEALDFGRASLVIASNESRAKALADQIRETVDTADIAYALPVATISCESDWRVFEETFPMVIIATPAMLEELLALRKRQRWLDPICAAVGRVCVPDLDAWPPALTTCTAFMIRGLMARWAALPSPPAFLVTMSDVPGADRCARLFVGKPLGDEIFVRGDEGLAHPMTIVEYSPPLETDKDRFGEWVRRDLADDIGGSAWAGATLGATSSCRGLLDYLTLRGCQERHRIETHYVLDVSGSMKGVLAKVQEAMLQDLARRLSSRAGTPPTGQPDHVRVTVFNRKSRQVFSDACGSDTLDKCSDAVQKLKCRGGTNAPKGMLTALQLSSGGDADTIEMLVFSDGQTEIKAETKTELEALCQRLRFEERNVRVIYVSLGIEPPDETRRLVESLGGCVVATAAETLTADELKAASFIDEHDKPQHVLFLSDEGGLSSSVLQHARTGMREMLYVRDAAKLTCDPASIVAVVASGRALSESFVRQQVAALGRNDLPIFMLMDRDGWSYRQQQEFVHRERLLPRPLIFTGNPNTAGKMVPLCMGSGPLSPVQERYLRDGESAYGTMLAPAVEEHRGDQHPAGTSLSCFLDAVSSGRTSSRDAPCPPLDIFGVNPICLTGEGISTRRDAESASLAYHRGVRMEAGDRCAVTLDKESDSIPLAPATKDTVIPVLGDVEISPIQPITLSKRTLDGIGDIEGGFVTLKAKVVGVRYCPDSRVEGKEVRYAETHTVELYTHAFRWRPVDAQGDLAAGLAAATRRGMVSLFHYAEQTVLPLARENGDIWMFDLSPGGNGATDMLMEDLGMSGFRAALALAGRVLLDCPCQGDGGGDSCPTCGFITVDVRQSEKKAADQPRGSAKRLVLEWLLEHGHLPPAANLHLRDKYEGVQDAGRVTGADQGTRWAFLRRIRSALTHRLGVDIPEQVIPGFSWAQGTSADDATCDAERGIVSMAKGLPEQRAFMAYARAFSECLVGRLEGFYNADALEKQSQPHVPKGFFASGAAAWLAFHLIDAVIFPDRIRLADIARSDTAQAGFRCLNWIEENAGGVFAVMRFLATGDLDEATGKRIESVGHLLREAGVTL